MRSLLLLTCVFIITFLTHSPSYPLKRKIRESDNYEHKTISRNLSDKEVQSVLDGIRKSFDNIAETQKVVESFDNIAETQKIVEKEEDEKKPETIVYPKENIFDTGGYMNEPIGPIEHIHGADVFYVRRKHSKTPHPTANITTKYSPITLDHSWSELHRLLFVFVCSVAGNIMNGFYVASFFVERSLNARGNVFLACLGLSDLIMTAGVMPSSAVVLLSGQWENSLVCNGMYFGAETSCYSYSLLFLFTAMETYIRLFVSQSYHWFNATRIGIIAVSVYLLSIVLAAVGVLMKLDFDYCERKHPGNEIWRLVTGMLFHYIPGILTLAILIYNAYGIKNRARDHPNYRRTRMYKIDRSLSKLNMFIFVVYAISWSPYLYVTYYYPDAADNRFYYSAWGGVFRSVLSAVFYCFANKNFKDAYANLFNYCCCKISLQSNVNNRHRRGVETRPMTGETRVHLMQPVVAGPQRSTSAARVTQEIVQNRARGPNVRRPRNARREFPREAEPASDQPRRGADLLYYHERLV